MSLNELRECVEVLESMASMSSRQRRITEVERITDEYILGSARPIDAALLERMANVILHEELTDNDKDKMSKIITADMTEDQVKQYSYPIMSDSMYARRTEGKHKGGKRKDGLVYREVPLSKAINRGADGKDYNAPTRNYV